jgi:hypothetical protein
MKFFAVYGNCQGNVLGLFLQENSGFRNQYRQIILTPCYEITPEEINDFVKKKIKKLDLFIYVPTKDDYRNNYYLSSGYLLSHLRPDCIRISFPSLYYQVYDPQTTYLTDVNGRRIQEPHEYHDKILITMFLRYQHLPDKEIIKKYIKYIIDENNFNGDDLNKAARSSYEELKRREHLLEKDEKNYYCLKIADFIELNSRKIRLFYSLNHPSKYVYLHLCQQVFSILGISEDDPDPLLDPHEEFKCGIFPPVKKYLGLQFEDRTSFPNSKITFNKYLEFYRSCGTEKLVSIGIYPESGLFIYTNDWSENEVTHRWAISDNAEIEIISGNSEPEIFSLLFTLFVLKPQKIQLSLNGIEIRTINFTPVCLSSYIALEVKLNCGGNTLHLASDTSPASPGINDPRMLSFAISGISIIRKPASRWKKFLGLRSLIENFKYI